MTEDKRAARRRFVRRHHPDVGGDPEVFQQGLEEFEPPAPVPLVVAPVPPVIPAGPPVTDRIARGLGRFVARTTAMPGEVKDAYQDGRHTDNPL